MEANNDKVNLIHGETQRTILICTVDDGATVAQLAYEDFTHHAHTHLDLKAPPPMLDEYGLSKRREVDCMISYQWDNQIFVRKVYEDMSIREIRVWFDIWGSMQMRPWLQKSTCINLTNLKQYPAGIRLAEAVRKVDHAQPPDVVDDCSAELFELRCLLDDARDAISGESGQSRFKICTRCSQKCDEYTKGGCKNHRTFYMGGTILEGRWVCCRQQARDSLGCNSCDHTDITRLLRDTT
ncbi:unnamed protein product [Rotaria socialis]|uniref:Uncharacterized protein n=1 Tax=Rotaria socialis TaxID=392032 RepID=A0A821GCS5_9BILA|nr:unnamed protein product [Rotaria socialis]